MSQLIKCPAPGHLAAKIQAIHKALDEVPDLTDRMENGKPIRPAIAAMIRALESYPMGLHSNPLKKQKSTLYLTDSRISRVLSVLHSDECESTCEWHTFGEITMLLEFGLGDLLPVYREEETRAQVYERKGDAQPQKKKRPGSKKANG